MISARPWVLASQLPIVADARRKSSRRFLSSISAPLPLPVVSSDVSNTPSYERVDALLKQKLSDLEYSFSIQGNPSRIWSQYTSLVNDFGRESLPLEIHQRVLRQCTPPTWKLRYSAARRLLVGNIPQVPHIHEGRFQTVIRAIRGMGMKPELEDYHFILEQFAAVGHQVGSFQVYNEILHLGLQPTPKTFGLCFQAIAHRLTLPVSILHHSRLIAQTKKMTIELLHDMKKYRASFTPVSLDLCTRILKEALDSNGFDSLMKWGYGIDLSNPDRPALEYAGVEDRKVDVGISDIELPALPATVPFSTMALNTTIDMLGRLGNVSKMIQAFEVLTQPLPQASQHLFLSFDDDDFGVKVPVSQTFNQYAEPNTTTYTLLIRHICRARHAILARHYLLQLIKLEKQRRHVLRQQLKAGPLNQVNAPRISVTRKILLAVYGHSHRHKRVGLMKWLHSKLPAIIKGKRTELSFCEHIREKLMHTQEILYQQEYMYSNDISPPTEVLMPSSSAPSALLRAVRPHRLPRLRWNPAKVGTALDMDLDQEPAPNPLRETKPFDLNLHIELLERELKRIEHLASQIDDILARTIQRVKERLGRRVWNSKDIYLSASDGRSTLSRAQWTEIVNFKPRRGYPSDRHSFRPPAVSRSRKGDQLMRIYRRPLVKSRSYSGVTVSPPVAATVPLSEPPIVPVSRRNIFSMWNHLSLFIPWT